VHPSRNGAHGQSARGVPAARRGDAGETRSGWRLPAAAWASSTRSPNATVLWHTSARFALELHPFATNPSRSKFSHSVLAHRDPLRRTFKRRTFAGSPGRRIPIMLNNLARCRRGAIPPLPVHWGKNVRRTERCEPGRRKRPAAKATKQMEEKTNAFFTLLPPCCCSARCSGLLLVRPAARPPKSRQDRRGKGADKAKGKGPRQGQEKRQQKPFFVDFDMFTVN